MAEIIKGTIIEWLPAPKEGDEQEQTPEPQGLRLMERVLWVCPQRKDVVAISLDEKRKPLPIFRLMEDLNDAMEHDLAFRRLVDPYAKYAKPDEDFLEKHKGTRDRSYKIIMDIAKKEPDIYFPETRGRLIREAAEEHDAERCEVYSSLRRFWIRGMMPNAVLPNYGRCGAPGVERVIIDLAAVKRGRPLKIQLVDPEHAGVNIDEDTKKIIRIALKLYYNSRKSQQNTLRDAYDLMIINHFSIGERVERNRIVKVLPPSSQLPSFDQFKYWSGKQQVTAESIIKRVGKSAFNLNYRPILGDSTQMAQGPGSIYQIDATIMDVYAVSVLNRNRIAGRPVLYFVTDVFSRMIVGIYVGFEGPSWIGAMMAIANATINKVAFCAEYGIEISEEEWPCGFCCEEWLADGGEMKSLNSDNLVELGMAVANCPPYRGDFKGIVERMFGKSNQVTTKWLPGAVHERAPGERDHRLDAQVDVRQITELIINMVIEHNLSHYMDYYRPDRDVIADDVQPIPIALWNWGIVHRSGHLIEKTPDVIRLNLMPNDSATVTPEGIKFKKLHYNCDRAKTEQWFTRARYDGSWQIRVSFDTRRADQIYYRLDDNNFEVCTLVEADAQFSQSSFEEVDDYFSIKNLRSKQNEDNRLSSAARRHAANEEVIAKAMALKKASPPEDVSNTRRLKDISKNHNEEKKRNRQNEAFRLEGQGANDNADITPQLEATIAENSPAPPVITAAVQKKNMLDTLRKTSKGE